MSYINFPNDTVFGRAALSMMNIDWPLPVRLVVAVPMTALLLLHKAAKALGFSDSSA